MNQDGKISNSLTIPLSIEERKNLYATYGDFINKSSNLETAGAIAKENIIFFVLQNGEIFKYYETKFKKIVNLERSVLSPPKIYNDILYIGTASGELIAISLKEVKILWEQKVFNKPIISPPLVRDEFIVLQSPDDDLFLIDQKNGETKKIIKNDSLSSEYKVASFSSPSFDEKEGIIFYGTQNGILNAVGIDFKRLWKTQLKEGISSFTGTPIIGENNVFIHLGGKYVFGIDKKTGEKIWEKEIGSIGGMGTYEHEIFVISRDGIFTILDMKKGEKIREKKLNLKGINEVSISGDGKIVIGLSSGYLYIISKEFKILQKIKLEGSISSPISIFPGGLAVLTDTGNAYVFRGRK